MTISRMARWKYRAILGTELLAPRRFIRRICVFRAGGIGDILMMTPALRGLRAKYPWAHLVVETPSTELFDLNPYVDQAVCSAAEATFDMYVHLVYEHRLPLREHITDIFCRCEGVPPQGRTLDLFFRVEEHRAMAERLKPFRQPIVVIQPWAGAWTRNKDWPLERWEQVVACARCGSGAMRRHGLP